MSIIYVNSQNITDEKTSMKCFSKILFVSAAMLALFSCSKKDPQDGWDSKPAAG